MTGAVAGRVAMVTGAGSGIGRATAQALAAEGATVAVVDVDAAGGRQTADQLPGAGWFLPADVTREADLAGATAEVVDRAGGIDLVVGCAGVSGPFGRSVPDLAVEDWDRVFAVNVRGLFLLAKHTIPALRRRGGGSVVLLGSDSSFVAAPGTAAYCATKGAVLMLTRALSVDHAPDQIRVHCVCPSIVDTPMARADLGPAGFPGSAVHTPAEIAALVLFLCSPAARTVNGTALVADFGGLARSPFPA